MPEGQSLTQWTAPPLPGESLVERIFTAGGTPVRIAAHERLESAPEELVRRLETELREVSADDEVALTWGEIRFEERGGELRVTAQDSRSPQRIARARCDDVSQLLWVEQSWRAVQEAAGFETQPSVHYRDTKLWITPQMLNRTEPVELRRAEGKVEWFLGEQPFDERLYTRLAGSLKFAANVFKFRPEVIPAMCLPPGWRALIGHGRGIDEIRDESGRVVHCG